jgi:hypothetical protein
MGRRIETLELHAATKGGGKPDAYFDRVIKYIPADVVSAWVFAAASIKAASDDVPKTLVLWIAFACGLILTALWTIKQTSVPGRPTAVVQVAVSTVAFAVWVFALGGPFESLTFYRPLYGSLVLVLYTLSAALIVPK